MAARTDLEKYPFALHLCENFITLVEGPGRRRPGFRYVNTVKSSVRAWLKRFDFGNQTYYIEFGNQTIRFFTNHGALLEATKTITNATAANPVVITSNAHGYSNGQTVFISNMPKMRQLNNKFFKTSAVAANTFALQDQDGNNINGTAFAADTTGSVARVYEIASPYIIDSFTGLSLVNDDGASIFKTHQVGDVLYIAASTGDPATPIGYAPRKLTRLADTNWTLTEYAPTNGPFLEINTGDIAMWASAQEGSVTVRTTGALFSSASVNRLIRLNVTNSTAVAWVTNVAKAVGDFVKHGENTYKAVNAATTGTNPPVHTDGIASDGAVLWEYQHSGYGIVKISAFTSSTQVTATVQSCQPGGVARLPVEVVGTPFAITGLTAANPGVVTAVGHTFVNNDVIAIDGVGGMTQVNGRYFVAAGVAANTFQLLGTNTTNYTAYTAGGQAIKGATFSWQLGAWSAESGYPTAVTSSFGRIAWLFGNRLALSVAADFENMAQDEFGVVTSESAISVIAPEVINGRWLIDIQNLYIGAQNGEFVMRPQTDSEPFGPSNQLVRKQGRRGCDDMQPTDTGELVLFVQRSGRKVFASTFNFDSDKIKSYDMTAFARHAQKPYLIDMRYQGESTPINWAARIDGQLAGMTFEPDQNVNAWHRHPIGGENGCVIEAIEVGQAPDGTREELWAIIKVTVNGVERRYVGFMEDDWEDGDDITDAFYVDLGLTYSAAVATTTLGVPVGADVLGFSGNFTAAGTFKFIAADVGKRIVVKTSSARYSAEITAYTNETTVVATVTEAFASGILSYADWFLSSKTITGLEHLEGLTVQVNRDGGEESDHTVTSGAVTLDEFPLKAHIGLGCPARLVPMRLDQGSQNGTAQGKLGRVHEITLRVMDTVGGRCGPFGGRLDRVPFRTVSMAMDTAIPAFTGDKRLPFAGNSGRDDNQLTPNTRPEYLADKPFPVTIVGLIPYYVKND